MPHYRPTATHSTSLALLRLATTIERSREDQELLEKRHEPKYFLISGGGLFVTVLYQVFVIFPFGTVFASNPRAGLFFSGVCTGILNLVAIAIIGVAFCSARRSMRSGAYDALVESARDQHVRLKWYLWTFILCWAPVSIAEALWQILITQTHEPWECHGALVVIHNLMPFLISISSSQGALNVLNYRSNRACITKLCSNWPIMRDCTSWIIGYSQRSSWWVSNSGDSGNSSRGSSEGPGRGMRRHFSSSASERLSAADSVDNKYDPRLSSPLLPPMESGSEHDKSHAPDCLEAGGDDAFRDRQDGDGGGDNTGRGGTASDLPSRMVSIKIGLEPRDSSIGQFKCGNGGGGGEGGRDADRVRIDSNRSSDGLDFGEEWDTHDRGSILSVPHISTDDIVCSSEAFASGGACDGVYHAVVSVPSSSAVARTAPGQRHRREHGKEPHNRLAAVKTVMLRAGEELETNPGGTAHEIRMLAELQAASLVAARVVRFHGIVDLLYSKRVGIVCELCPLTLEDLVMGSDTTTRAKLAAFERASQLSSEGYVAEALQTLDMGMVRGAETKVGAEAMERASATLAAGPEALYTPKHCVRIACELCSAVSHMHLSGVVHRDLKPLNLLLDMDLRLVICDVSTGWWFGSCDCEVYN